MRTPHPSPGLLPALLLCLIGTAPPAWTDDAAVLYLEVCSGCHSIGGGEMGGPDLLPSTAWPADELRAAVDRMQENSGPMTAEQIDALVSLLRDPAVLDRIAAAESPAAETADPAPAGMPEEGRRLFFGERQLANGGTPCFGCHAFHGRGGTIAADLSASAARMGATGLRSVTERPGFPLMKAAYAGRPVTEEEALHLVAYLETAPGPEPGASRLTLLHAGAGGIALVILAAAALLSLNRREGARSRMVSEARRRNEP